MKKLQLLCFCSLFMLSSAKAADTYLEPPNSHISALVDLYNATEGQNWNYSNNWLTGSVCTWSGVTCTAELISETTDGNIYSQKIVELELGSNGLTGPIPDSLGNLSELENLNLSQNHFNSSLPDTIGNLSKLITLVISSSKLTGNIPDSLGSLNQLTLLNMSWNYLEGSIPSSLGNLSQLTTLMLYNNSLTGSIPDSIGGLNQLITLYLQNNALTGGIPDSLGNMSQLTTLFLYDNQLSGIIPDSLGNLSQLETLYLSSNQLNGIIPDALGGLSKLKTLGLGRNLLTGDVPASLGNLSLLEGLHLGVNKLDGIISDAIGNLSQLKTFAVHDNQLTGSIPDTFGNLSNLTQLFISKNELSGNIPSSLGNLSQLTRLQASRNQFSGEIPEALMELIDTNHLYLSYDSNDELGAPLASDFPTKYPWITSQLVKNTNMIYNLGELSCFPDTDNYAQLLNGKSWTKYTCSTEENSCPEENTGPECLAGNPINMRTGVKQQSSTDYSTSVQSALKVERSYNSVNRQWSFNISSKSLLMGSDIRYVKVRGRSKSNYLFFCSEIVPIACDPQKLIGQELIHQGYKLDKLIDGYVFTLPSGSTEKYDTNGILTSITNKHGKILNYTYGVSSITVSDEFNQQVVFTLNSGVVEEAATPIGTFSYSYDEFGRLTIVTKPDNTTIRYNYDEINYSTVQYFSNAENCIDNDYLIIEACKTAVTKLGLLTGKIDEKGQRMASWYYDDKQRAYKSEHGTNIDVTEIQFISEQGQSGIDAQGNPIVLQRVRDVISPLGQRIRTTFRPPFGQRAEKVEYFDSADSLTATELYSYNANGYVGEYVDVNGLKTTYSRYSDGREYSRVENAGTANARTISTSYSGSTNKPTQITTPETRVNISYINHNSGLLISKQNTTDLSTNKQRITNFAYNAQGQLISIDGSRTDISDITTFEYNAQGLKNKSTNALGHVTQITAFNAHGKPLTLVDENNITTTLTYDVMGSMLSYERAGLTVTFTYDLNGVLTSSTLSDGTTINYEYDSANRLVAIEDNIYNRIEYTLDNAGNKLSTTIKDPASTLRFHQQQLFDEFGRITGFVDGNTNSESKQYLANGLLDKEVDALSYSDDYAYNALAQLSSITAPDTGTTTFSYDNAGRANAIIDAEGKITTYTYNGFGELIEEVNPNTGTTTYRYDEAGNITQQQESSGAETRTTTYQYDALNRIISDSAQSVLYSYDDTTGGNVGIGKLTGIADEGGNTQITYNTHGSVTSETRLINDQTFITSYQYGSLGRLVGMTYPNGRAINYTLDSKAQIASVSMTIEGVTTALASNIQYLPFGPVTSYTYGNGLVKSMTFDNNYQLSSNTTTGVEDLSYSYTARNNVNAITDVLDSSVDQTFNYSPVSALSNATGSYGALGFDYDLILNRASRTKNGSTDTYTYETGKHLLQSISGSSTTSFTYNAFGDTTQKDSTSFTYNNAGRLSSVNDGDLTNYQYDYQGRRISKSNSLGIVYYLYDLNGLLIAESDNGGNITTEYIYLNGQLLSIVGSTVASASVSEEVIVDNDGSNTTSTGTWKFKNDKKDEAYGESFRLARGKRVSTYRWQPVLIGGTYEVYAYWKRNRKYSKKAPYTIVHAGIRNVVKVNQRKKGNRWNLLGRFNFNGNGSEYVELSDRNGKVVADAVKFVRVDPEPSTEPLLAFVHTNHLGAPVYLTDTLGNKLWQASYSPFGKATIDNDVDGDSKTIEMNVRFPGQYYDQESGLHYNYFRDYDPELGRYIQSDPIGLAGGINTYGYVGGNPINFVDPIGLLAWRGTQTTTAAGEGGGAVRFKFTLESECDENGNKANIEVVAGGTMLTLGIPVSFTYSRDVTFNDGKSQVDPSVFAGEARYGYASWAMSFTGVGYQWLQIGDAEAIGGGYQMGWDLSVAAGAGVSTVTKSSITSCGCE